MRLASRLRATAIGLAAAALLAPTAATTKPAAPALESARASPTAVHALAPTGRLRVALVLGAPATWIRGTTAEDARGVGFDLGRVLAGRLGVPFEPVAYATPAELMDGLAAGEWDVAFVARTPERERVMDLAPTFLRIELGYLVPAGSPLATMAAVDAVGVRVGAPKGGSVNGALTTVLRHATVVPVPGLAAVPDALAQHTIDVFAANKANLFQLMEKLPGARVLDESIGEDEYTAGLPKGRNSAGAAFLSRYLAEAGGSGAVRAAVARAGLRGAVDP